jgi:DNA repair protein RadA/Sms
MTIPSLSFLPGRRSTTISASKGANEIYFCEECGFEHLKWVGRCNSCKAWDTVKAFREAKLTTSPLDPSRARKMMPMQSSSGARGPGLTAPWFGMAGSNSSLIPMDSVDLNAATYRIKLFSEEMNRVLGGGLVRGSVVLLAGDPGVGKVRILER